MISHPEQINTLVELKQYVIHSLCQIDQLVPGAFPITERIITKSGKACGMYFCLHGPRSSKFTAIWETERNTIIFYGATGERIHMTQIVPHNPFSNQKHQAHQPHQSKAVNSKQRKASQQMTTV